MATWRINQQNKQNSSKQKTQYQKSRSSTIRPRLLIYDISTGTIKYVTATPFVIYKKEYITKIGDLIEESNGDYLLKPAYLRYIEEDNFRSATIVTTQEKYILQTSKQYPHLFEVKHPLFVNNQIVLDPLFRTVTLYDNR
jgi:hypothetical protein